MTSPGRYAKEDEEEGDEVDVKDEGWENGERHCDRSIQRASALQGVSRNLRGLL